MSLSPLTDWAEIVNFEGRLGKYDGMTANERLLHAGLFDVWDQAFRARDRARMIAVYRQIEASENDAASAVDLILADPAMFGF